MKNPNKNQVIELGQILISANPETKKVWQQSIDEHGLPKTDEQGFNSGYIVVSQQYVEWDGMKQQRFQRDFEKNEDGSWNKPTFILDDNGNKKMLSLSMTIPMTEDEAEGLVEGMDYIPKGLSGAIVRKLSNTKVNSSYVQVINPKTGKPVIDDNGKPRFQSKSIVIGITLDEFNKINDSYVDTTTPTKVSNSLMSIANNLDFDNPVEEKVEILQPEEMLA